MDKRFLYPRNLEELVNMLPKGVLNLITQEKKWLDQIDIPKYIIRHR